jgi:hypothetical protein
MLLLSIYFEKEPENRLPEDFQCKKGPFSKREEA